MIGLRTAASVIFTAISPRRRVRVTTARRVRDALEHVTLPGLYPLDQPDGTCPGASEPPTAGSASTQVPFGAVRPAPSSDVLPAPRRNLDEAVAPERRAS